MCIRPFICFLFWVGTCTVFGQVSRQTYYEKQFWGAYFTQLRLSQRWGVWVDVHFRRTGHFIEKPAHYIFRGACTYYFNEGMQVSGGYAFIQHFPEINPSIPFQNEHRIWQQLQGYTAFKRSKLMNWVRLEERFRNKTANDSTLGKSHIFDFCLRNNLQLTIPFSKKGLQAHTVAGVVNNELFINFFNPNNAIYTPFEQNRFFIGLSYQLPHNSSFQLGYMNVYQQLTPNKEFKSINAVRLFYFQHIDLRKLTNRKHS